MDSQLQNFHLILKLTIKKEDERQFSLLGKRVNKISKKTLPTFVVILFYYSAKVP